MDYLSAVNAIVDDGIEECRLVYTRPDQSLKRDGAIRGFEECRGLSPHEIAALLGRAKADREDARRREAPDYWYWRMREAQVEWVANVVSALLYNQGLPVIVPPTARGMLKAADVVGVAPEPRRPASP
jgi:hypothetical protein